MQFELSFDSQGELEGVMAQDLERGRAFVPGVRDVAPRSPCQLVLRCAELEGAFIIDAEAVWCDPNGSGVGLEFVDWTKERAEALVEFASKKKPNVKRATNVYERVRRLKSHEQQQLARQCGQAERIALERCFGGAVWEALLQNPQLTGPEVANIARKGSLPRPVLASIVANASWLAVPEVQRALLANPRLEASAISRILRCMPRAELARIPQQTRYAARVRNEARRLLNA